ncbi:hypothetical protein D0T12_30295 [Actinomadura spongiicola]|uniref:Uncharacterized protein n=1 Tax=Actinomadura spongiicola TaxID=2303421 RepID=A0A372G9D5_9ACTN|nr:hypothetical protein [Actinomadura spongiicola]RFS81990.1 hypothetical protein D0T12_30295 [Actinomadura spongiicola]
MSTQQAFWLDNRHDREAGESGAGRYAETLFANLGEFEGTWGDIAPVSFACAAWRVATPPISSPGLVRWHRRVLSVSCVRNTWDGSLTAGVTLVSPLPDALQTTRTWWRDRGWQGWPEVFGQFVEPAQQDLAKVPYARATLLVDAPLPLEGLPAAPDDPDDHLVDTAHRALTVMVAGLNELLTPIITQLESAP